MPSTRDELYALAKKKRSAKNLEAIQEMLTELREHADKADEALSALTRIREDAETFSENLDDENVFLPSGSEISEKITAFLDMLPESDENVDDLITEAEEYAGEYELCLDDKDYSADNREEVWGNLCDALENIAGVMT